MTTIDIVKIDWDGPFSSDEVSKFDGPTDCGIYQIYGAHAMYGTPALLYIGQCDSSRFATRLKQHEQEWMKYESMVPMIFMGRLCDVGNASEEEVGRMIDDAERMLIYFCAPSYNSEGLKRLRLTQSFESQLLKEDVALPEREDIRSRTKGIAVLNFGRRFLLPQVCSSLVESECLPLCRYAMPFS